MTQDKLTQLRDEQDSVLFDGDESTHMFNEIDLETELMVRASMR